MKVYVLYTNSKSWIEILGVFSSHDKAYLAACKSFGNLMGSSNPNMIRIVERELDYDDENKERWYDDVAIWIMKDDHTFYKPLGNTPDIICHAIVDFWRTNPYCMVCPIRFMKDGKYVGEPVGKHVHGNGPQDEDNFMKELMLWRRAMVSNNDVIVWLNKKADK